MTNMDRTVLVLGATRGHWKRNRARSEPPWIEDARAGPERTPCKLNRFMGVGEG